VAEQPRHPISEAFRKLRTSIQFSSVDRPARTVLITSPLPTDGKTFTAANLAVAVAQAGKSVILVDADLRHSMQHRLFGLPKEPGLTTALLSSDDRHGVLHQTEVEGLRLVPTGSQPPNPAELLSSQTFQEFVSWLSEQADIVIFDSAPVLAVTDATVLSTLADGTLVVLDCGETRRAAAMQAVENLTAVGGKVLGVVLNRMALRGNGYYYYYYYYRGEDDHAEREGKRTRWIPRLLRRKGRPRHRSRSAQRSQEAEERR
jgi:capsular exopolysaccharide synthesis family protein